MQEQQNQIKIYGFFQKAVYFIVTLECLAVLLYGKNIAFATGILEKLKGMGFFFPPINAKIATLFLIILVAIGTRAQKKADLNVFKEIIVPLVVGLGMIISSLALANSIIQEAQNNSFEIAQKSKKADILKIQEAFVDLLNSPSTNSLALLKKGLAREYIETQFGFTDKKLTQINIIFHDVNYSSGRIGIDPAKVEQKILYNISHPETLPINIYSILYVILAFAGAVLTQSGADSISKLMQTKMGKDRFNIEEESFQQNTTLSEGEDLINIPYLFRFNKKVHQGWMNINPFRGTMVIGTPGSGKSFGVINPAIRQMISKNYSACIYDFKFPDLGVIAYYHYKKRKYEDPEYKHKFNVINLNDVRKSQRVNPFNKKYINTLAKAQETSDAIVSALQKGGSSGGGGADAFFTQSAINFLSSSIYFFAKYDNGKYSDLAHILAFMNLGYEEIFTALFTNPELESLLSPFQTAFQNKAFDQLEGQVGTLKIFISRLNTKESAWIFSGDDVNLKITDPADPSILILASDPQTQEINSTLYASVLNRTLSEINSKGNLRGAVIADEFPTIYIHKIDNLVATARSNKVAVLLGLQELTQLRQFYKKEVADTISSIMGNILSGSVRDKNTLTWLETLFGKIKQKSYSQSISQQGTSTSINEKMDNMIPAGKIAALRTGEMVGMLAGGEENNQEEYKTSAVSGKISLDSEQLKKEEAGYKILKEKMPEFYSFKNALGQDIMDQTLMANQNRIREEVINIVKKIIREKNNENKYV